MPGWLLLLSYLPAAFTATLYPTLALTSLQQVLQEVNASDSEEDREPELPQPQTVQVGPETERKRQEVLSKLQGPDSNFETGMRVRIVCEVQQ